MQTSGRRLNILATEYGLLLMLLVLALIFTVLNPSFFTLTNFTTVLAQNAALLVISLGATFAIISRNIDLSPGSLIALCGTIIGLVFTQTGNIFLGLLAGLLAIVLHDGFHRLFIARLRIYPLVVTFAGQVWARGLGVRLTRAHP